VRALGNRSILGLLLGSILGAPCLAQFGGDLQAQILYGYQTEDVNELADLRQTLSTEVRDDAGNLALHYHLAHADLRYAEVVAGKNPAAAEDALADCVHHMKAILEKDASSVEALVLDSKCLAELAAHRKVEGVLLRTQAADRLAAAGKLAPANPRVLLLSAENDLEHAKDGSPASARGFEELKQAAARFEESSATSIDAPGWGHADAYLALGRQYAHRGDILAARNWIEKALIAAPDYRAAQRALAALVHR
jgi:tetratricopeptide (TPR) repeat protein